MNKSQELLGLVEGNVKIIWSEVTDDYASDSDVRKSENTIAKMMKSHPGSTGGLLAPEEYSDLDRNYNAVWSPDSANMDDVVKAVMKEHEGE